MGPESRAPRSRGIGGLIWFLVGVVGTLVVVALIGPVILVNHRNALPGQPEYGAFAIGAASSLYADKSLAPLPTSTDALAQGRLNYSRMCVGCHGPEGAGNGPQARNVFPPPRDLTSTQAKGMSDGQLVWVIERGLAYTAMPSYGGALNRDRVLEVVGWIRAMQNGTTANIPAPPAQGPPGGAPGGAPGGQPAATPRPAS